MRTHREGAVIFRVIVGIWFAEVEEVQSNEIAQITYGCDERRAVARQVAVGELKNTQVAQAGQPLERNATGEVRVGEVELQQVR